MYCELNYIKTGKSISHWRELCRREGRFVGTILGEMMVNEKVIKIFGNTKITPKTKAQKTMNNLLSLCFHLVGGTGFEPVTSTV